MSRYNVNQKFIILNTRSYILYSNKFDDLDNWGWSFDTSIIIKKTRNGTEIIH